jgi:hypothetical protein
MFVSKDYVLPELLDSVLGYLPHWDIHSCSLVNKQFSARATPLLYLDLPFYLHTKFRTRLRTRQKELFARFRQSPQLAANIRRIEICLNTRVKEQKSDEECTKFGDEIADILQNSSSLENLLFNNDSRTGTSETAQLEDEIVRRALITILCAVVELKSSPKITLKLLHCLDDGTGNNDAEGRQLAQLFGSRVSALSVRQISLTHLQTIGHFSHLDSLEITSPVDHDSYQTADFEAIFEGVPLTRLIMDYGSVRSLPRTVQDLRVGRYDQLQGPLCQAGWGAICRLRHLSSLDLAYHSEVKLWVGQPTPFSSSNLRNLTVRFLDHGRGKTDIDWLTTHILRPIVEHCSRHLETVEWYSYADDVSADFLETIFNAADKMSSIDVHTERGARAYQFQTLLTWLQNAPRLRDLQLPWPSEVSGRPEPDSLEPRWDAILEDLSFRQCQQLAALCPQLDCVRFNIGSYPGSLREACEQFRRTTHSKRIDALGCICEKARQNAWFQSLKMTRLIDTASPCLKLCTILCEDFEYEVEDDTVLYLSLRLVRRHGDHPYVPDRVLSDRTGVVNFVVSSCEVSPM